MAKAGSAPFTALDFSSQQFGNVNNVFIRNNIVTGFQGAWIAGTNGAGNTNITGMTLTHNDAFGNGSNVPSWPGGNPANYTYNNNRSVNPLFMSSTDFRLQLTSPLIDAGVYVGSAFVGNAPDDGYNEIGAVTLPVILIDFTVNESGGRNILNWNTASESNSSYFSIERSNDAQTYYSIGRVNASGFSSAEVKYNFTDDNPLEGKNYYRLVMIDKDGALEYSKIVSISNKKNNSLRIIYIDLSSGTNTASIIINSTKTQAASLSIIDVTGRVLLNAEIKLQKGNNTITKSHPAISKGIYYVRIFTPEETVVHNTVSRN